MYPAARNLESLDPVLPPLLTKLQPPQIETENTIN